MTPFKIRERILKNPWVLWALLFFGFSPTKVIEQSPRYAQETMQHVLNLADRDENSVQRW